MTRDETLAAWRFVRSCRPVKPVRLCTWLVSAGGIRDDGGDVRSMIGSPSSRPGLISKRGMRLDDAALAAWQAGYIGDGSDGRPSINDLLEAIERDLTTEGVYRRDDFDAYAEWAEWMTYYHALDRDGIAGLVSVAQVLRALSSCPVGDVPF